MLKRLPIALVLCALPAEIGCSATDYGEPSCENAEHVLCAPSGVPFATAAVVITDACYGPALCSNPTSATKVVLSQPEDGKVCFKGTVAGRDGSSILILQFNQFNAKGTHVFSPLDAKALGAKQLAFTLEQPPAGGVTVHAQTVEKQNCLQGVPYCMSDAFDLMTGPRTNLVMSIRDSEPQIAPFSNFQQELAPNRLFEGAGLGHIYFQVGPGEFDVCVSDFHFLDAEGKEIVP